MKVFRIFNRLLFVSGFLFYFSNGVLQNRFFKLTLSKRILKHNFMTIQEVIYFIKDQIGVELELCDYFTGVRKRAFDDSKYFNVVFKDRLILSKEYRKLESYAYLYDFMKIEANGLKRAAITLLKTELKN